MNEIVNNIISSYNSLWKVRIHGNTTEVITPVSTTNNMFVSVFITKRGDDYIVTDGGWIDSGVYECEIGFDDACYYKLFQYYMEDYEIMNLTAKGKLYYYKKVSDPRFIPNLVYDLSNFINAVISASFISFEEKKEHERIGVFRRNASNYLREIVSDKNLKTNFSIHEDLGLIKFSAVAIIKNRFTLINYVTGSNDSHFILSIGKSNINYDIIENHSINKFVKAKIALYDDTTKVINSNRVRPYLEILNSKKGRIALKWKDRSNLKSLIEQ